MQTHVKVLGVLFIVFGALGVLGALGIMAIFGGAAGIVGSAADGEEAMVAIPIIGLTGSFLMIFRAYGLWVLLSNETERLFDPQSLVPGS